MKTYEERTADVMDKVAHKKKVHKQVALISSCSFVCVVVLVLSLVLFLPFSATGGNTSPYQNVIDVLHPITQPYRNNFEKLTASIADSVSLPKGSMAANDYAAEPRGGVDIADSAGTVIEESVSNNKGETYQENTNNQVEGVREGDLLKQSTNYFYYLRIVPSGEEIKAPYFYGYYDDMVYISYDGYYGKRMYGYYYTYMLELDIYRKNGTDTTLTSSFTFAPAKGNFRGFSTKEMYLNDACDTITVVADGFYSEDGITYTVAFALDISDLDNIKVKGEQYVTGSYVSSRMSDGRLLVITDYYPGDIEYDDPDTFIPYVVDAKGKANLVAPEDIIVPESLDYAEYTVVSLFDSDLKPVDKMAFLGYSSNVYATGDHLYVSHANDVYDNADFADSTEACDTTTLYCVSYGADGLKTMAHVLVTGSILNQYSMDEYQGVLRIATTIRTYTRYDYGNNYSWWTTEKMNAGLYCYSTETWKLIAKEEYFAPADETVRSARFMGTKAYVCTAVQSRDPVFCFDLSDYDHITYTHTGEITGFSMSLTPFVEDSLVGIGVDEDWDLKVELYRQGEKDVLSIGKLAIENTSLESEYKTYLFNTQYALIGVPGYRYAQYDYHWDEENQMWVDDVYQEGGQYYYLFQYKDDELVLAKTIDLTVGDTRYMDCGYYLQNVRAAVSDGYVYLFLDDMCKVVALS